MTNSLIGPGENPDLNACLNYGVDNWVAYTAGYRTAAELLTRHVRQTHAYQDTLIFPVIYLWRHHLELRIKGIARSAADLLDRPWKPPKGHDLSILFGDARVLIQEAFRYVGEKPPTKDVRLVRSALAALATIDPGSMAFRYPEDLDGNKHLADVRYINFDNLEDFFHSIADVLDQVEMAISVFHDWKQDAMVW